MFAAVSHWPGGLGVATIMSSSNTNRKWNNGYNRPFILEVWDSHSAVDTSDLIVTEDRFFASRVTTLLWGLWHEHIDGSACSSHHRVDLHRHRNSLRKRRWLVITFAMKRMSWEKVREAARDAMVCNDLRHHPKRDNTVPHFRIS